MYLLDIWLSRKGNTNLEKARQVLAELTSILPHTEGITKLEDRVSYICKKFSEYWKQASSSKTKLVAKHQEWLNAVEICKLPLLKLEKDEAEQIAAEPQQW